MTLVSLLIHDVTIVSPALVANRYGGMEKDWDNATDVTTKGWVAQRSTTEEIGGGREAQVSEWVCFLHPDETVEAADRISWGDITFEVAGTVNPAWSPRGEHHLEVPLRVVTG